MPVATAGVVVEESATRRQQVAAGRNRERDASIFVDSVCCLLVYTLGDRRCWASVKKLYRRGRRDWSESRGWVELSKEGTRFRVRVAGGKKRGEDGSTSSTRRG